MMEKKDVDFTELGTLAGIVVGAGLGLALFASTGQLMLLSIAGLGAVIGLFAGTMIDTSLHPPES